MAGDYRRSRAGRFVRGNAAGRPAPQVSTVNTSRVVPPQQTANTSKKART